MSSKAANSSNQPANGRAAAEPTEMLPSGGPVRSTRTWMSTTPWWFAHWPASVSSSYGSCPGVAAGLSVVRRRPGNGSPVDRDNLSPGSGYEGLIGLVLTYAHSARALGAELDREKIRNDYGCLDWPTTTMI